MSESGLERVFMGMRPALTRYIQARGFTREDAEDIVQDLYFRLDSHVGGPVDNPQAYFYRMAHNLLLDRKRSTQRRIRRDEEWTAGGTGMISETDDRPSAEDTLIARQRLAAIGAALGTLPERTRDIFRRFRIDEQTQKDIAADIGITKSAVEKHLYRAYRVVAAARAALDDPSSSATLPSGLRLTDMGGDHDS
jgi:RNA polymerase sigma-70 factor (ECF subfamily)